MVGWFNIPLHALGKCPGNVPSCLKGGTGGSASVYFPFRDCPACLTAYTRARACVYNYINYKIMFLLYASFFGVATCCFIICYKQKASFLRNEKRGIYGFLSGIASFLRRKSEVFTILVQKRDFYEKNSEFLRNSRPYSLQSAFFHQMKLPLFSDKSEFFTISKIEKRVFYDFLHQLDAPLLPFKPYLLCPGSLIS